MGDGSENAMMMTMIMIMTMMTMMTLMTMIIAALSGFYSTITARHRSRRPLAMGSLGWEQCHRCWAWRIWSPNNVDRAENYLRLWLQRSGDPHLRRAATFIAREVAEHLAACWQV